MKISEARKLYNSQICSYREQQMKLMQQKKDLEQKMKTAPDKTVYANEAAVLELSLEAVTKKKDEYQTYMNKLAEQWAATANMVSSEQQGEAMEEYVEDLGKIMEVARRLMKGGVVPATEKKRGMILFGKRKKRKNMRIR